MNFRSGYYFFLTFVLIVAAGWFLSVQHHSAQAQLWQISVNPPPDNTPNLLPLDPINGDNLGRGNPFINPHKGYQDLDLNHFRLHGISSTDNETALRVGVYQGQATGSLITSIDASAILTETFSNQPTHVGLSVINESKSLALDARSVSGRGALFYGNTVAERGLVIGNNITNILATSSHSQAKSPLYWGSQILCYPDRSNCGFVSNATGVGDGLGNHIATTTLNMSGKRLYSAASTVETSILQISGETATSSVAIRALDNYGIFSRASSPQSDTSAGIYARSLANSPGLRSSSWRGYGLKVSSPLEIMIDPLVGQESVLHFGQRSGDTLNTSGVAIVPKSPLYWGNTRLCDSSQPNCGIVAPGGGTSPWTANSLGIHFPEPPSATKNVLLGTDVRRDAKLDVRHSYVAGQESSSNYILGIVALPSGAHARDVSVVGKYAYVASTQNNAGVSGGGSLHVVDVTNLSVPRVISTLALASPAWGLAVSGKYAYIATMTGLKIVDISQPHQPSQVGSGYSYCTESNEMIPTFQFPNSHPTDVVVSGNYAYVSYYRTNSGPCNGQPRLESINVSTPSTPVLAAGLNVTGPRDLAISGNNLFVGEVSNASNGRVLWYDISNPASFLLKDALTSGSVKPVRGIAVDGDLLYFVSDELNIWRFSGNSLTHIADTDDGSFPNTYADPSVRGVVVEDGYVHISYNALYYHDTSQVPTISGSDTLPIGSIPGNSDRFTIQGDTMFISYGDQGLYLINNQGFRSSLVSTASFTAYDLNVDRTLRIGGNATFGAGALGGSMSVWGTITLPATEGLLLNGTVLDQTRLSGLKTKAGL